MYSNSTTIRKRIERDSYTVGLPLIGTTIKGTLTSPCLTMLPRNSPNTDTSPANANNISHMNKIKSDMEKIQTTSYMKRSPHLSITRIKNSSIKY